MTKKNVKFNKNISLLLNFDPSEVESLIDKQIHVGDNLIFNDKIYIVIRKKDTKLKRIALVRRPKKKIFKSILKKK